MGGQPWLSSWSINGSMASSWERKGRGRGVGGAARGAARGRHGEGEGCRRHHGLQPAAASCVLFAVRERAEREEGEK
jgi:hypothetical protein